jgi:hypothetical protein
MTPPLEPHAAELLARSAGRTYRYLRLTIVGLVLLLAVSVTLEATQCGGWLGSISAAYYTPARSVFVGSLIGIGAALIAIRGREGTENALLNIAGMSAGLIALVPTPRPLFVGTCGVARVDVAASVQNNGWALLATGLFGLAAAAISTATSPRTGRRTLVAAALLWIAVLLWFLLARESFLQAAHYAASALLFALLTVIAALNAVRARFQADPPLLPATAYRAIYWVVAATMGLTMLVAGAWWFAYLAGAAGPGGAMLWIETVLIAAFAVFWLAQSAQFWRSGVPEPPDLLSGTAPRSGDRRPGP